MLPAEKKTQSDPYNIKIGELWNLSRFTGINILKCSKWTYLPFKGHWEGIAMNHDGSQYFLSAVLLRNLRDACCFPPAWNERTLALPSSKSMMRPNQSQSTCWVKMTWSKCTKTLMRYYSPFGRFIMFQSKSIKVAWGVFFVSVSTPFLEHLPIDHNVDPKRHPRRNPSWRSIPDPSRIRPKWRRV